MIKALFTGTLPYIGVKPIEETIGVHISLSGMGEHRLPIHVKVQIIISIHFLDGFHKFFIIQKIVPVQKRLSVEINIDGGTAPIDRHGLAHQGIIKFFGGVSWPACILKTQIEFMFVEEREFRTAKLPLFSEIVNASHSGLGTGNTAFVIIMLVDHIERQTIMTRDIEVIEGDGVFALIVPEPLVLSGIKNLGGGGLIKPDIIIAKIFITKN
jgi:hypothetical protein